MFKTKITFFNACEISDELKMKIENLLKEEGICNPFISSENTSIGFIKNFQYRIIDDIFIGEEIERHINDFALINKEIDENTKDNIIETLKGLIGTIAIDKYIGEDSIIEIPESINNIPVTAVSSMAFYSHNSFVNSGKIFSPFVPIHTIKLPNTIKYLGVNSFACNDIKNVELSKNLMFIGNTAFDSNKIRDLVFPNNLKFIGRRAFSKNQLSKVRINNKCIIHSEAFSNNPLKEVFLNESLYKNRKLYFKNLDNKRSNDSLFEEISFNIIK
ncbi:leucine-rich repeat protein [Clostridium perfringens]